MKARRKQLRFMGLSAMMAGVLCVLSPITLPVGMVPITLSVLALFLVATLAPVRVALCATAVYLAVGAVGLPVFSSFTGGFYAFVSPSGGFLWGYLPAVLILSFLAQKGRRNVWLLPMGFLAALLVLYFFGCLGFCVLTGAGIKEALAVTVLPFLLLDLVKIIAVFLIFRACQVKKFEIVC